MCVWVCACVWGRLSVCWYECVRACVCYATPVDGRIVLSVLMKIFFLTGLLYLLCFHSVAYQIPQRISLARRQYTWHYWGCNNSVFVTVESHFSCLDLDTVCVCVCVKTYLHQLWCWYNTFCTVSYFLISVSWTNIDRWILMLLNQIMMMLDLLNLLKKLFQLALACMCSVRFLCLSKVLVQFSSRSRSFLTDPQGSAFLPPGPGASPLLVCHMLLPQSTRLIVHHSPSSRGCRLAQNNLATWRPHLDSGPYVASKEKKGHLKRHLRYIFGATSWESKKIYTVYHSTITYPRLQVPSRK